MSNSDPRDNGLTLEQKAQYQRTLARLDRYAGMLDSRYRIPFTRIRFGLEPLIGLLPGIGDLAGFGLSLYLVGEAIKLRAGPGVVGKMLGNIAVDFVVGLVPILGDVFDLVWRANDRNATLLRNHIEQTLRPPKPRTPWLTRGLWALFGVLVVTLLVILSAAI